MNFYKKKKDLRKTVCMAPRYEYNMIRDNENKHNSLCSVMWGETAEKNGVA